MDRLIERLILGLRWLLLPLYLMLFLTLFAIYARVGAEVWHLAATAASARDIDLVMLICSLLDLVLIANLLVMVAVSSYESYISRIEAPRGESPEWLGKLDSGNIKVKVAVAVAMISMIHLLRAFLDDEPNRKLLTLAAVHVVFVLSAVGVAMVDRVHRPANAH